MDKNISEISELRRRSDTLEWFLERTLFGWTKKVKTPKYTDEKILSIISEAEKGRSISDLCKAYRISSSTIYNWMDRYKSLSVEELSYVRELELEAYRLKRKCKEEDIKARLIIDALNYKGD